MLVEAEEKLNQAKSHLNQFLCPMDEAEIIFVTGKLHLQKADQRQAKMLISKAKDRFQRLGMQKK